MYLHSKADHEFPRGTSVQTVYMVCSVPRSGSSLLCELLLSTGVAGAPTEYLEHSVVDGFTQAWGLDSFASYLAALRDRKTSPNGVFGLKVHFSQWVDNRERAEVRALADGARFVAIYRRDKLRQAISYWRAVQTEQWASVHPTPAREPEFDYEQIRAYLDRIHAEEQGWESLFAERGAQPLRLDYEDLVAAPEQTVHSVLDFLEIRQVPETPLPPPTIEQQADAVTEEWLARYRTLEAKRP
jgi:LPS sulfotransferase NodH